MSGLLQQYFRKHSDLSIHPAEDLANIAAKLNPQPRKQLRWATPAQLFNTELESE
jgi:IS30 family transposase